MSSWSSSSGGRVGRRAHRRLPAVGPACTGAAAGLATQPLPHRPGRGQARLRPGRAARQRERRRGRAGHHLAVAAQSVRPPRLGYAARNPKVVRQRTGQPATPSLDPVFVALNPASSPPVNAHRPSCTTGSAATRSTPSWARMWWSSCTARAGPARQPPAPGRSSGGPTAATGWPANAPAAPTAANPSVATALADPSTPGTGNGGQCPLTLPARPAGQRAVVRPVLPILMSLAPGPRRRWVRQSFEYRFLGYPPRPN
jgi:hypothetical protein